MNTLCIYYDLTNFDENYHLLKEYLGGYEGYERAGDKIWFIVTDKSTTEVRNEINECLAAGGSKIIVFTVGEHFSFSGLAEVDSNWLRDNWYPN